MISADRLISSIDNLSEIFNDLDELEKLYRGNENSGEALVSQIEEMNASFEERFPNSERSFKQESVCDELIDDPCNVSALFGPAGVGKTKIFLDFIGKTNPKKVFIICPRVVIAEGIFSELLSEYIPNASIEVLTGEIKEKSRNGVVSELKDNERFESDIVITSIDQIVSVMNSHKNMNIFTSFMQSHVIFDEFHEYVNLPGFNLRFLELVKAKLTIGRTLLVSATPNPTFLEKMLDGEVEIHKIETFDLADKKVGVIGTGMIGKKFIKIAKAFGMEVLAFDKYPDKE